MKIINARILGDGVNLFIEYKKDNEPEYVVSHLLVISLEKVIKNYEIADAVTEILHEQEES